MYTRRKKTKTNKTVTKQMAPAAGELRFRPTGARTAVALVAGLLLSFLGGTVVRAGGDGGGGARRFTHPAAVDFRL